VDKGRLQRLQFLKESFTITEHTNNGAPRNCPFSKDGQQLGERGRIRTCDPCLKRALLYHLSYAPNLRRINDLLRNNLKIGCTAVAQFRKPLSEFDESNFTSTSDSS
jgi:hypothetical protein